MPNIQAVLTDIGGVVLRVHVERTRRLLAQAAGIEFDEVAHVDFAAVDRLETGQWGVRDLYENTDEHIRAAVSFQQFADAWNACLGTDYDSVREAYLALPPNVPLYALSNTNDLHLAELRKHWLYSQAAGFYASNAIGLRKPDSRAFEYALDHMGQEAKEVLYFDDRMANVEAARRVGMLAVHVDNEQAVPEALDKLGLV